MMNPLPSLTILTSDRLTSIYLSFSRCVEFLVILSLIFTRYTFFNISKETGFIKTVCEPGSIVPLLKFTLIFAH